MDYTLYKYVGPQEILNRVQSDLGGELINNIEKLKNWSIKNGYRKGETTICTFTIDIDNQLFIADRHSEHVQCALGKDVKSAGEIAFIVENKGDVIVEHVTNQSTGYCPCSKSWKEVEKALIKLEGLIYPSSFCSLPIK